MDAYRLTAREAADWPLWYAPAAFAVCVAIVAVLAGLLAAGDVRFGVVVGTLLVDVPLVAVALALAGVVEPPEPWQFGLRPTSGALAIGAALGGFAAVCLVTTLYLAQLGPVDPVEDPALALIVATVGLSPAAEEFFFRGFVYGTLRRGAGAPAAVCATTVMFLAAHWLAGYPAWALVPIGCLGVASCVVYELTGSIYPCIALHMANNAALLSHLIR